MEEQDNAPRASTSRPGEDSDAPARDAEQGDAAEPDAPTAGEENEGLSTILSGDTLTGVQRDAGEE